VLEITALADHTLTRSSSLERAHERLSRRTLLAGLGSRAAFMGGLAMLCGCQYVASPPTGPAAGRLDDALSLLTTGARGAPARQQTLRSTLDWSYSLLTGTEQRLFERLSVFAGGWTLEAAEVICTDEALAQADVLDGLHGLVAKSLVVSERHAGAPYRYRLLETIRQYGSEKLARAEEHDALRRRHADFFLAFAEPLQTPLGDDAGNQLERERDNLRATYEWFVEQGESVKALRVAGFLGRFWHFPEGRAWASMTTIEFFGDI